MKTLNMHQYYIFGLKEEFKRVIENSDNPLYKELKNLRVTNSNLQISPKTRTLYLWTKRGASRHCKNPMLNQYPLFL